MKQQAAQMEHQAVVAAVGKLIKVLNFFDHYLLISSFMCIFRSIPGLFKENL